ncbi:MAG: hypothetical protein IJT41_07085 [Clostridia bacterium]|nr:hypothetical protein [Clostridia bacterium]
MRKYLRAGKEICGSDAVSIVRTKMHIFGQFVIQVGMHALKCVTSITAHGSIFLVADLERKEESVLYMRKNLRAGKYAAALRQVWHALKCVSENSTRVGTH